jgi:RNA polymerase sigma factor (sigma-70 family)
MRDDPSVVALVTRAAGDDYEAWNEIVERYVPLVWAICTRYQLSRDDSEDVGQTVWLLLVEQLGKLREPAALPGWLATTTRRECLRVVTATRKTQPAGAMLDDTPPLPDDPAIDEEMLIAERNAALRVAFAGLPRQGQQLLSMLFRDPPCSYSEIRDTLGIPMGSIGPKRARYLERLRQSPALIGFEESEFTTSIQGGGRGA